MANVKFISFKIGKVYRHNFDLKRFMFISQVDDFMGWFIEHDEEVTPWEPKIFKPKPKLIHFRELLLSY